MNVFVEVGGVLLVAWIAPLLAVGALARDMVHRQALVPNYRGRKVFLGLGVAWLVAAVAGALPWWEAPRVIGGQGLLLVVPAAFAFGLLDDALGSGADRGFRGHLAALRKGRLTTGMLKALGIGVLALAAAPAATAEAAQGYDTSGVVVATLAGAAVIALSANLVNLVDLRPARALKVCVLLSVPAAMAAGATAYAGASREIGAALGALLVLGPISAVWPYDAGEIGMLGDAGANAAGALAGWLAASVLPVPWLVGWAAVLLALNLASERVSFSAVVQRHRALRWLDGLGRPDSGESRRD